MEREPAITRRVTRASTKRRAKSSAQELGKKKRTTDRGKQEAMLATTMKQYSVKMQDVSIGLQRLRPLTAKENCVARSSKPRLQPQPAPTDAMGRAVAIGSDMMEVTPEPDVVSLSSPLPQLGWANSVSLWMQMRAKDVSKAAPEQELCLLHPGILPSMRTILFDWLMEVCEEYKLHRETYYLTIDMYDRFLDTQTGIQKEHLQAIGITCLFIASKIEEIYPPKVTEFAYVTDGACGVADILDMELVICKALNWKLNHHMVSVNTWVNTYMQLSSHHLRPPGMKTREFEYPAYSPLEFIRVLQLLDISTLDIQSRHFSSSILAASALYLASERSRQHFQTITGLELDDINMCVSWMYPFALIITQKGTILQKTFPGVIPQDVHNIQTHSVSISMLEDALELRSQQESLSSQGQLTLLPDCSVVMTPPRRCLAPINVSSTCS